MLKEILVIDDNPDIRFLVCNILDPDIIVLGGGMSNISYIYDHINNSLKKYIFSNTFNTRVVKNVHGDSGGVRGAAWLS